MPKIVVDADVFQAVMQVISERGYRGATTKRMAQAAGISEVTLFRKYGSKAELVTRALAELANETDLDSAIRYTGDVHADLLRVVQKYQDAVVRFGRFFVTLLAEVPRQPELVRSVSAPLGFLRSIGQLLARYQEDGMLRREHPLHAAIALLGPPIYSEMIHNALPGSSVPPLDLPDHVTCYLQGRGSEK